MFEHMETTCTKITPRNFTETSRYRVTIGSLAQGTVARTQGGLWTAKRTGGNALGVFSTRSAAINALVSR